MVPFDKFRDSPLLTAARRVLRWHSKDARLRVLVGVRSERKLRATAEVKCTVGCG